MDDEDIREQLLHVKKIHSAILRENGQYKTKLRIAERERNKREEEINRLLSVPEKTKSLNKLSLTENRIEIMSLRRKVLLYERLLKEKTRENDKLLEDKKVVEAAETRKLTEKLENECQRLRIHLSQSIPETEFLKEKDQYLIIINRLIDENMHLRQVVGKFEQKRKESEKLLTELGGGETLVKQFRTMSVNSRKQANFYKKALTNLMSKSRVKLPAATSRRRPTLASTSSQKLKNKNLNGSKSEFSLNFLNENSLRTDISPKNDFKYVKKRASSLESSKASKSLKNEQTIDNKDVNAYLNQNTPESNNSFCKHPLNSSSNNSKLEFAEDNDSEQNLDEEEKEEEGEEEIEEEEEEEEEVSEESDEKEIEEMVGEGVFLNIYKENEETQLNALHRLFTSHIIRQQMCKVREDRDTYSKQMMVGILKQEPQKYYW